jgi:hypothetical protein
MTELGSILQQAIAERELNASLTATIVARVSQLQFGRKVTVLKSWNEERWMLRVSNGVIYFYDFMRGIFVPNFAMEDNSEDYFAADLAQAIRLAERVEYDLVSKPFSVDMLS